MTRSARPSSAYDEDFFTWTQDQAAALRAGERGRIDAEHLAEEIEDLGRRAGRHADMETNEAPNAVAVTTPLR